MQPPPEPETGWREDWVAPGRTMADLPEPGSDLPTNAGAATMTPEGLKGPPVPAGFETKPPSDEGDLTNLMRDFLESEEE